MAMTFDIAVAALDDIVQSKATHGTKDLCLRMQAMCNMKWGSKEEQQDFSQICSNFDKYVTATNKTSIGRKQFEAWWETQGLAGELTEDPLPSSFEDAIDQLTEAFKDADNSKEEYDCRRENTRLRNKVKELEAELKAANQKLDNIKGIILWG